MSATTIVNILLLLSTVLLTSSCSLLRPPIDQEELQQAALTRWSDCIERNRDAPDRVNRNLYKVVSARCEGHQRDVIATFPAHLENQIDVILSERSYSMTTDRFLQSSNQSPWNFSESTHVDTLKLRSSSARANDL